MTLKLLLYNPINLENIPVLYQIKYSLVIFYIILGNVLDIEYLRQPWMRGTGQAGGKGTLQGALQCPSASPLWLTKSCIKHTVTPRSEPSWMIGMVTVASQNTPLPPLF